ncbi:MAG TPA: sensor histidine kinase [Methanospirillum sp.]|nr:sensor histidine kinase [Methanospirillum sp.]
MQLLSSVTRHDLLNKISCAEVLIEQYLVHHSDQGGTNTDLSNALGILDQIEEFLTNIREYEKTGIAPPHWINLHEALKSAIERIPDEINLDCDLPPIHIYADTLLDRAFYNLVDNAIIHGGSISLIRITMQEDDHCLIISVQDDGVGVPKEDKEKIFQLGYGTHTGFGLFFIREVLAITQIEITECGVPGRGARFEIRVPEAGWRMQ